METTLLTRLAEHGITGLLLALAIAGLIYLSREIKVINAARIVEAQQAREREEARAQELIRAMLASAAGLEDGRAATEKLTSTIEKLLERLTSRGIRP